MGQAWSRIHGWTPVKHQDWTDEALCLQVDPDLMYPNYDLPSQVQEAKAVCEGCPVRVECIQLAYATDDHYAVMGGTTPRERDRARRRGAA